VDHTGAQWRVYQLDYPKDLKSDPVVTDLCGKNCYAWTLDGTKRPAAFFAPGGNPAAMWVGLNGIWAGNATSKPSAASINGTGVADLAPVVSNNKIGALWRGDTGLALTLIGGKSAAPTSCFSNTGVFAGLEAAGRGRVWMGAFSTQPLGPVVTEFASFFVVDDTWAEISNCKLDTGSAVTGMATPGIVAYKRPQSSTDERVHFGVAGVLAGDSSVAVSATYIELQPGKAELAGVGKFDMKGMPTPKRADSKGVDQPAVAYAGDKLLVAWRDWASSVGGWQGTLRLRRFKLCQ
jgi:hypothetical protein